MPGLLKYVIKDGSLEARLISEDCWEQLGSALPGVYDDVMLQINSRERSSGVTTGVHPRKASIGKRIVAPRSVVKRATARCTNKFQQLRGVLEHPVHPPRSVI